VTPAPRAAHGLLDLSGTRGGSGHDLVRDVHVSVDAARDAETFAAAGHVHGEARDARGAIPAADVRGGTKRTCRNRHHDARAVVGLPPIDWCHIVGEHGPRESCGYERPPRRVALLLPRIPVMRRERHTLDRHPGSIPDIRADASNITFTMVPLGRSPRERLVIRCDADGEIWISITTDPGARE
jgi:hypothetical protein